MLGGTKAAMVEAAAAALGRLDLLVNNAGTPGVTRTVPPDRLDMITDEMWVDANFKESDLAHMRPGQHAVVKVDAHPDLKLDAKVESISPGTGSSFSLLPAENATGNWVKVVQRVPVRLVFTRRPPIPLQAGLSASVKVDSEHRRFGGSAPKP